MYYVPNLYLKLHWLWYSSKGRLLGNTDNLIPYKFVFSFSIIGFFTSLSQWVE